MGRPIIVLGDKTSRGGTVIEASMFTSTHGKGWGRVGDRVSCHRNCRIATGDPFLIDDGKAVARHGDKTTCGQTLISSQLFSTDAIEGSTAASTATAASLAFAQPEFSDAGRNNPVPGMQQVGRRGFGDNTKKPLPPLSIPGEQVPDNQNIGSDSRSRPSRGDDARTRPPGRAPLADTYGTPPEGPEDDDDKENSDPKREQYLGRTPGKNSRTGKEVQARMRANGELRDGRNGVEFKSKDGEWYPLKDADMAHTKDAVKYWNETGRYHGAKSPEVREWMLDSKNYRLEHYSTNRSAGALLPDRYLPPASK